jgi:hypothetical protein
MAWCTSDKSGKPNQYQEFFSYNLTATALSREERNTDSYDPARAG